MRRRRTFCAPSGPSSRSSQETKEVLKVVELVGPKTAERIRELVGGEYKG
jgi:ERCC4-type nuclease